MPGWKGSETMTLESACDDLLSHMEWADAMIWSTVLGSSEARADLKLQDRLYHIHFTQHAFLQVWRELAADLPAPHTLDIVSLARWARTFHIEARADRSWLTADALGRRAPDTLVSKAEARLGVGAAWPAMSDTVLQVILHSTYHRGQVGTRLRELGCEPPLTEYFVWVWRGKPAADWPAVASGSAPN